MIFWYNKKFLKADDLLLLFLQKKLFFIWFSHADLFVVQIEPEIAIFRGFTNFFFFRTTGLQQKLLILIEHPQHISLEINRKIGCGLRDKIWAKLGPMLWKNKETGIISGLFSYFALGVYTFKNKKQWLQKYLSGDWRPKKQEIPHLKKTRKHFCLPFWVKFDYFWGF